MVHFLPEEMIPSQSSQRQWWDGLLGWRTGLSFCIKQLSAKPVVGCKFCQCADTASQWYLFTGFQFQPDKLILSCHIWMSSLCARTSGEGPALDRPLCKVCALLFQHGSVRESEERVLTFWTWILLFCLWFSPCRQQPLEDSVITLCLNAF